MNISTARIFTTDTKAREMIKYLTVSVWSLSAAMGGWLAYDYHVDVVDVMTLSNAKNHKAAKYFEGERDFWMDRTLSRIEDIKKLEAENLSLSNQVAELTPEPVINPDPMAATVVLKTPGGGKCTGTHIGNGTILTAGHCTDKEGDTLTATFKNGREFEAETLWKSEAYDVALLRMADATVIEIKDGMPYSVDVIASDNPSASIDCRAPVMNEKVDMYGHPMAMTWIVTSGRVAGEITDAYKSAWREALPIDGAMGPGQSGGGVFSEAGALRGINVGIPLAQIGFNSQTFTGISFIVPASTICGLMGYPS